MFLEICAKDRYVLSVSIDMYIKLGLLRYTYMNILLIIII